MKTRTALKVWFEIGDCHRSGTITRYRRRTALRASLRLGRFSNYIRSNLLTMYYQQHPRSEA